MGQPEVRMNRAARGDVSKTEMAARNFVTAPWAVLGICAVILSATLSYPFNNDNALYAYMAELALHGGLPYSGSWDQNFPAIILIHLPQIALFGHSQLAFHLWDIALQLGGSLALYRLGTTLFDRRAGALAAIFAAFYYIHQGLWMAGERDTYVTILLLWSIVCLTQRPARTLSAGLLLGTALLFRPTYALYAPIASIWIFLATRDALMMIRLRRAAYVALGAAIPPVLLCIGYWLMGGLRDLYEATILFNLKIYSGSGASFSFWDPIRFYLPVALVALVGCSILWRRGDRDRLSLVLAMWAASLISLLVLYRHSVYHYHPMMVLFLLLAAGGWVAIMDASSGLGARLPRPASRILIALIALIAIGYSSMTALRGNTIQHVLRDLATGKIHSLAEMYSYYEGSPEFGVAIQQQVADYLSAHTNRGAPVQMFGPYSYPQYASGTVTVSRFQTVHAFTMRGQGDALQPFQIQWRREYLAALRASPPVYFIVCDGPEAFRQYYGGRLGHEILREDFTELGAWLAQNYAPETKIGAFTIYGHK